MSVQRVACALTLLSVIVMVWMADRWNKPMPCFDSPFVRTFHVQIDSNLEEIPSCRFSSLWEAPGPLSNLQLALFQKSLKDLTLWTQEFGAYSAPVRVRVNLAAPRELRVSATAVDIGVDRIASHGQLVRGFLQVWLLQRIPGLKQRPNAEREILADLALAHVQGEMAFETPGAAQAGNFQRRHWFRDLYSWQALCHSVWATSLIESQCGEREPHRFSTWSLRPLVGTLFWQTYLNLPMVIKARYFAKWMNYQTRQAARSADLWDENIYDFQGRAHTSSIFKAFVQATDYLGDIGDNSIAKFWRQSMNQVLARPEYATDNKSSNLYVRIEQPFQMTEFTDVLKSPDNTRLIVVAHHFEHYILPSGEPVELVMDTPHIFEQWVRQTCTDFDLKNILSERNQPRKILLVDRCAQVGAVHYQELMEGGVESFAHHNPVTAFIEIRPDAMVLAAQLTHANLGSIQWQWSNRGVSSVEGLLGLFQPKWSELAQAFQVNGVVEGIAWFRGPNPTQWPHLN